jgi:hypothetical protein
MEVHHHSHTERKKWTHYFWEFLMLFLAVTLGFFVENKREHYIEHVRVKEFARSLASDIARDTANMTYIINRIKTQIKNTDSLTAYLKHHKFHEIHNIDLFALTVLDRYPAYRWSRSTLEQIKNSGSLRYFGDTMVRYISSYDALSRHMDEDHRNDEEMANRATASRDRIIDISYPNELAQELYLQPDSLLKATYYQDFAAHDKTPLLTNDSITLKIFLNEKLNIRRNLAIRADDELKSLVSQGRKLIQLLKNKYHFQ